VNTTVRNNKIPSNHRKPSMTKNRSTKDAVSPSVRGIKTIIPSTVGIAERARYEYRKLTRDAEIIVDTLRLVRAAQRTGDASLIAATKPLIPMIQKALDKLARAADSLARETAATSNEDKPEATPQSQVSSAPALVEGDPDVAAGLIADQAFTNYTPEAIERRAARDAKVARLGYAIECGDLATQHEIQFGGPQREDKDPYASIGHKGE